MTDIKSKNTSTERLEFFSDGVFAIAITLLIIEIKVPTEAELHFGLYQALLHKWPSYLAFFIGFFTTLVCWINHHFTFSYITKSSQIFNIVNALVLFVVAFVQFPTAVLAEFITKPDAQIAGQLYGVTYIMMAMAYRILWGYACSNELTDPDADETYKKGIKRMYNWGVVHTLIAFIVSFWSLPITLFLYVVLFSLFMIPATYTRLIMKFYKT
jgi:uncharacterized membrane protein